MSAIQNGSTVQFEYTLKDNTGTLLDTNTGAMPLTYVHGEQQIILGLERALTGMRAGEEKQVVIPPDEGYGEADPKALAEVPKHALPDGALVVGTKLVARKTDGASATVFVKEVKDHTVILDLNHPLAGKTLFFEIKILNVDAPQGVA